MPKKNWLFSWKTEFLLDLIVKHRMKTWGNYLFFSTDLQEFYSSRLCVRRRTTSSSRRWTRSSNWPSLEAQNWTCIKLGKLNQLNKSTWMFSLIGQKKQKDWLFIRGIRCSSLIWSAEWKSKWELVLLQNRFLYKHHSLLKEQDSRTWWLPHHGSRVLIPSLLEVVNILLTRALIHLQHLLGLIRTMDWCAHLPWTMYLLLCSFLWESPLAAGVLHLQSRDQNSNLRSSIRYKCLLHHQVAAGVFRPNSASKSKEI